MSTVIISSRLVYNRFLSPSHLCFRWQDMSLTLEKLLVGSYWSRITGGFQTSLLCPSTQPAEPCRVLTFPSMQHSLKKERKKKLAQGKPACQNGNKPNHREKNLVGAKRVRKKLNHELFCLRKFTVFKWDKAVFSCLVYRLLVTWGIAPSVSSFRVFRATRTSFMAPSNFIGHFQQMSL